MYGGVSSNNSAYAVVTGDGEQRNWTVELLTGDASDPGGLDGVTDMAPALDEDQSRANGRRTPTVASGARTGQRA